MKFFIVATMLSLSVAAFAQQSGTTTPSTSPSTMGSGSAEAMDNSTGTMDSSSGTMNSDTTMGNGSTSTSDQQRMEDEEKKTDSESSNDMDTLPRQSGSSTLPSTTSP